MFGKKKDKGEDPKKAKDMAPEPVRAPPAAAPQPQASRPAGGRVSGAAIGAALDARRSPGAGAPASPESIAAQARAADELACSANTLEEAAATDLAAGNLDAGFEKLRRVSEQSGAADAWRRLGALAYHVAGPQSLHAYEQACRSAPRQFWDCLYLARLRGVAQQLPEAVDAALAAVNAAVDDAQRGMAHVDLCLIALAGNSPVDAVKQAEAALVATRRGGTGGRRELIARLALLADAKFANNNAAGAAPELGEALELVRAEGAAAPTDALTARSVCEVLEKVAAASAATGDHASAAKAIDEAITLRRRIAGSLPRDEGQRGIAQATGIKAELCATAGDAAGARAASAECLAILQTVAKASPKDMFAWRELWATVWQHAVKGAGADWRQVVATMDGMAAAGVLDDDGRRFLDEARRRAAA